MKGAKLLNEQGRYLITGGTGFIGSALIKKLNDKGIKNLVVVARNDRSLAALRSKFPGTTTIQGDISDPEICKKAVRDLKGIFHLAAFKHVRAAEHEPHRCIRTNIYGTINLLEQTVQTHRNHPIDFFIHVSTDKAAQLKGVYGATKFLAEKVMEEFGYQNKVTGYSSLRFGNILGSTGSFVSKWKHLIESGGEIKLTDPEATRFLIPVQEAADLIINCADSENGTKIQYETHTKAVSLKTALEVCMDIWGKAAVKVIGLQKGENKHETLDGSVYSNRVPQYTHKELKDMFLELDL